MSAGAQAIAAKPRQAPMSGFERYLTLWVALCIVAGVALGQGLPDVFQALGRMEVGPGHLPGG
ncbi:arsenical-resistance protein, partial [Acinetobacter baumannii]|nr:arsenical-resistance protein [Acinetobacter baumannii]